MAITRELRRRIKSVKNTAQITKAMQMVAATKMRRAQNQALNGRPYSFNLSSALKRLLPLINIESHPLLSGNGSGTQGVILLSTDKSLCGALNTNLFRLLLSSGITSGTAFYTVGKKGRNFVARSGRNLLADFENLDTVTFRQAVQLSKLVTDSFLNGEIGEAYLVYPQFISTLRQEPTKVKLLPVDLESIIASNARPESKDPGQARMTETQKEFIFEPDPDKLLDYILVHHIQIKIYQALLETKASEHSARMVAMQNATDNALELVSDLTLTYNQTRQDAITKELLEITTATMAMQ
ncbi:ATP synthase F1 subunit gamma [Candidatus Daviesbacteria bacterium RIFCSPHIGHO2_01_FULL_40_11]|uniref:ATP synthase gamma chain n=1 Tax=Candidatus Daviesbacteria bacterium RIFCSPHIGHO2_01_FULL_40_11 TaxID=1797762 RepID=A0A1F5JJD0_9BACT|nr:MAG: ATP synthase F1 subunit gamma [Candidatus Daviesbacteria bacterium RIFCSPHIGHO2_01_FULL_40_11]OGE62747.1 MAG: ATP synthase F1 subunit gamma [Candidatus Daviesbacteria bacterium RIFCSPLOWO2_01_FULL_40_27]